MTEDARRPPKDIFGFLDFYLVRKAPAIPDAGREWIVKWGPWIALVLLALTLPRGYYGFYSGFSIGTAFLILHFGLMILALPGLFTRKMQGWRLMFFAALVWVIEVLFYGAALNAIVGGIIALYVLFQIRSKYR